MYGTKYRDYGGAKKCFESWRQHTCNHCEIDPHGYAVGSFGGIVAFEIATEGKEQGKKIKYSTLLNSCMEFLNTIPLFHGKICTVKRSSKDRVLLKY
jgi:thioesterase domain-containing protein